MQETAEYLKKSYGQVDAPIAHLNATQMANYEEARRAARSAARTGMVLVSTCS